MLFCFGFENGAAKQQLQKWEICHRTGAIGRDLPCLSFWWEDWTLVEECLVAWMFWNFERMNGSLLFWVWVQKFSFNVYLEIRKKRFKISSHFGSRKATPKLEIGAVVIAKVNEAFSDPPFLGLRNDSQNGGRIVCFLKVLQRRPAHAKPDFNWLSGPRNEPWKCTCGINCLRSLCSNVAIAMQHHPGNIHESFATPRYSATPCNVLIQVPNVIDTTSKRWRSKQAFNTSLSHIFS